MSSLLAAALVIAATQFGAIQVNVDAGLEVYLDSRLMGKATPTGLRIVDVPVGAHTISVKTSWGSAIGYNVTVAQGKTSNVQVAAIGLRTRTRGEDSTIEVKVETQAPACDLVIGTDRVTKAPAELRIEHLRPGATNVNVKCAGKTASMDIYLGTGRLLTLQANFATGKMQVLSDESRVTQMTVQTPSDMIMRMSLPVDWKRALISAIVPGARLSSIRQISDSAVEAIISGNSSAVFKAMSAMQDDERVYSVQAGRYKYPDQSNGDYEIPIRVTFK